MKAWKNLTSSIDFDRYSSKTRFSVIAETAVFSNESVNILWKNIISCIDFDDKVAKHDFR